MAGFNFHIPLTLLFIVLTMFFNHCKAPSPPEPDPSHINNSSSTTRGNASSSMEPPQTETEATTRPPNKQGCSKYLPLLPRNNRSCTDASGLMPHSICFPLALSDGIVDVGRNLSIKPSRRFRISVPDPETNEAVETCPTKVESRNIGAEFMQEPGILLEDYHQMFLDLVEDLGWPECRMMVSTEGTTGPTNATQTEKMETTTTNQTTPTTTTPTSTPTTMTTTTTAPSVVPVNEVPKSYELVNALKNDCAIIINATLRPNGTFTIQLLHNTPEPIPGVGETMFKIDVTDKKVRLKARFTQSDEVVEYNRTDVFEDRNETELNVKIRVFNNKYKVFFGDDIVFNAVPNDDPLWAINYTYITGDLKIKKKPDVQCPKQQQRPGSIDWSNKLGIEKPTDIVLRNLQFNGNGSLVVYLLKGCAKFDTTVCNLAMEFELKFDKDKQNKTSSELMIYLHRRSSEDARTSAQVLGIPIYEGHKYGLTMSLSDTRGTGLMVHGHGWKHSEAEEELDKEWKQSQRITNKHADYVQILTKDAVEVGNWTLLTAPRPVNAMNGNKKFQPGQTEPPWNMEQKVANWANGDYIKLHIRMKQDMKKAVQLIFYRGGFPGWISVPAKTDEFGQVMLYMEIKQLDAKVLFKTDTCTWNNAMERNCEERKELKTQESVFVKPFQANKEYLLHIKAHENMDIKGKYANGLQVEVFDVKNNNTWSATYDPLGGPPAYAIEHFTVEEGDIQLMEEPKFCKKNDKMC